MKKSKKNLFVPLFIVFIMVMSTLGFLYSGESSNKYNGFSFKQTDRGWTTFIEKTNSYQTFDYLPKDVEGLGYVDFDSGFVYIIDNGNVAYGNSLKSIFTSVGIISQMESVEDCNSEFPVFVLNSDSELTEVYKENNCVYINGNLNKGIDFLAYIIFGVIKKDG